MISISAPARQISGGGYAWRGSIYDPVNDQGITVLEYLVTDENPRFLAIGTLDGSPVTLTAHAWAVDPTTLLSTPRFALDSIPPYDTPGYGRITGLEDDTTLFAFASRFGTEHLGFHSVNFVEGDQWFLDFDARSHNRSMASGQSFPSFDYPYGFIRTTAQDGLTFAPITVPVVTAILSAWSDFTPARSFYPFGEFGLGGHDVPYTLLPTLDFPSFQIPPDLFPFTEPYMAVGDRLLIFVMSVGNPAEIGILPIDSTDPVVGTPVVFDNFNRSVGSGWGNGWTVFNYNGGGTTSVDGDEGRITTAGGSFPGVIMRRDVSAFRGNSGYELEMTFRVSPINTGSAGGNRANMSFYTGNDLPTPTGMQRIGEVAIFLEFHNGTFGGGQPVGRIVMSPQNSVYQFGVVEPDNPGGRSTHLSKSDWTTNPYKVRWRVDGERQWFRLWQAADPEPEDWLLVGAFPTHDFDETPAPGFDNLYIDWMAFSNGTFDLWVDNITVAPVDRAFSDGQFAGSVSAIHGSVGLPEG